MICPICNEEIDDLEAHKSQEHESLEVYDDVDKFDIVEETEFDEIYGEDKKESEEGGVGSGPQDGTSGKRDATMDTKSKDSLDKMMSGLSDDQLQSYSNAKSPHFLDAHNKEQSKRKTSENWDNRTQNDRVLSFEALGFTQGDSMQMAEMSWTNLSTEVQYALEVEEEDKEDKREEDTDIFNDESSQPDTQIEEEDGIDYNIIGESLTSRTKYECERCNSGFKSNESLLTHFNDTHVQSKANEFSIDVPLACPFCMEDLGENETMGEHLAYTHGISSNSGLEEPIVEDNMVSDAPMDGAYEFKTNGKTKLKIGETHDEDEKQWEDVLDIVEEGGQGSGPQTKMNDAGDQMRADKSFLDQEEDTDRKYELTRGLPHQQGEEGGVGSGPQGGTALLPEQIAMANINPDYDAFSKDEGDPFTSPMIDSESLATEDELTKPLDEIEKEEEQKAEENDENDEIYEEIEDITKDTAEEEVNMIKGGNDYTKTHDFYGNKSEESFKKKIIGIEVLSPTQIMGTEEFREEDHPRADDGKFGSKGGDGSSGGKEPEDLGNLENALKEKGWDVPQHHLSNLGLTSNDSPEEAIKRLEQQEQDYDKDEPENKMASVSDKDLIKQIKGGSKDWHDWGRNENTEDAYAEIERRNREIPRPLGKFSSSIFRDDPDAVSKMENKVKVLEERQAYWKQITKFPSRDYKNHNQLGDMKYYELGNLSANLRDAKKKLVGIKAQQARGTTLTRKSTYPDNKKRFYYSEEPKEE